jgi:hypothetical protein
VTRTNEERLLEKQNDILKQGFATLAESILSAAEIVAESLREREGDDEGGR